MKLREEVTSQLFLAYKDDSYEKHSFFVHHKEVVKPKEVVCPVDDYRLKTARKREISVAIPLIPGRPLFSLCSLNRLSSVSLSSLC